MASSSSSRLALALSSQSWNHDVFLSFRGQDTRKTFVDHLYKSLVQQGIDTYKDEETLRRGESIHPSLMKAIDESQIGVVVFSKNYADSSWCLDELTHIMKCKDTRGQIVMPIFYNVSPCEVRKQKRKYGEAFAKHEQLENKKKVESWRKALVDASNLSGWETKNIANGHESKVIKEIVDTILSRLQLVTSSANEKLIGIATRVQSLKATLQIGSGGVRMIGIWGVGGGGKTTLAYSLYDEISRKFDGSCFIENIRKESSMHGLEKLQNKILKKMEGKSIRGGRCMIDKRFRNRRVLIVLDDVDQLDQLEALAGSHDWFGEGSRIIITTRDEHLLKAHEVVVHDISLLDIDESIELFRKHAFRGYIPMVDYEQFSKEVVSYAGGLPLALKVLGSSLCDKNIHEWRSTLARLKLIPENEILKKLKISFDGLTKVQKDLFLDIACFFRGREKDWAMDRLEACGFHPVIGVEELRQKALITLSRGRFDMHDLVQEMGHHIVRGEHPESPEKHSRVWKKEDILAICSMDATMELDKIEAINVHYGLLRDLPPIVANMKNLRYIQWPGDPANPLLNNFPPRKLSCLTLNEAIQDQLWNGYKYLPNLKMIELCQLKHLIRTPNFDGIPFLERFNLFGCPKLEEIHPSFGGLDMLVCLSIMECDGIEKFPSITRLKKLDTLAFKSCPRLFELSEIQQKMDSLGDENMSSVVWELSSLNNIQLCFFRRDLRKLNLSWCKLGDQDISSAVWELPNLQELDIRGNYFTQLNFSIIRIPRLKFLDVSNCICLVKLSELPSSISVLIANGCMSLKTVGANYNFEWLWQVSLNGAYNVDLVAAYILLDSMREGNAIEDHLISVALHPEISEAFGHRLFRGNTFTRRLPCDWYNDYCGFFIYIVTYDMQPKVNIIIKQEAGEDPPYELWQESYEELEQESDEEFEEGSDEKLKHESDEELEQESDEEYEQGYDEEFEKDSDVELEQESDEELDQESDEEFEQGSDEEFEQGSDEELEQEYDEEFEQESNEELEQDSDEEFECKYDRKTTYVGYVSFNSLRHTASLNSTYNVISISLNDYEISRVNGVMMGFRNKEGAGNKIGAELVPRRKKGDRVQTTKAATGESEFWDDEVSHYPTFTIEAGSKSSIKIVWRPNTY